MGIAEFEDVVDEELLERFFKKMSLIRAVEDSLLAVFETGAIRGTVHTCIGQEGIAVGVIEALDCERDIVCSNHRGHGHFLALTGDAEGLISEILGLDSGVCRGVGGSQHLHAPNFYSNGILGGMAPVAAGMALAEKMADSAAIVCTFHGDGAFGEGIVYETMNIASLWSLPLLICVEYNGYAQSTASELEHAGSLAQRAVPFGIPVNSVDGNDVAAVHDVASQAVARIREGRGPELLFCETYRLAPHSKGDDNRSPAELAEYWADEPIGRLRARLRPSWCEQVQADARDHVTDLIAAARASSST